MYETRDRSLGLVVFAAIVLGSLALFALFQWKAKRNASLPDPSYVEQPAEAGASAEAEADARAVELAGELASGRFREAEISRFFPTGPVGREKAQSAALVFERLFVGAGFGVFADRPIESVGEQGSGGISTRRFGLNLTEREQDTVCPHRVYIDLVDGGGALGWQVDGVYFPEPLQEILVSVESAPLAGPKAVGISSTLAEGTVLSGPKSSEDHAAVESAAREFYDALLQLDYARAREICDFSRLDSERVAALCFVFEEGQFQASAERPVLVTAAGGGVGWAIARVHSAVWDAEAEFGVELAEVERSDSGVGEGLQWKIVGLNFSELLAKYASASAAGEIAYAPVVANPDGGQSLVVYFQYDSAELHPRTRRQLDIVSDLLVGDSTRTLTVSGHADALGSADYNDVLAGDRAIAVQAYLAQRGVPAQQIVATSKGESRPLRPNVTATGDDNPDGRAMNRRAEIFLDF